MLILFLLVGLKSCVRFWRLFFWFVFFVWVLFFGWMAYDECECCVELVCMVIVEERIWLLGCETFSV